MTTSRQRKYQRKNKALGLCILCPNPVVLSYLGKPSHFCKKHLEANRKMSREYYHRNKRK
jgi:hypothetical protein